MYDKFSELDPKVRSKLIAKADSVRVVDATKKRDLYSWNNLDKSISFGDHRSPPYEPVEAVFVVASPDELAEVKALVLQIKGSQ